MLIQDPLVWADIGVCCLIGLAGFTGLVWFLYHSHLDQGSGETG